MKLIGLGLVAIPFAFGALRLATTGTDARYLWLASASTVAAAIVLLLLSRPSVRVARVVAAFVASTAAAGLAGYLVDARNIIAIGIVSIAFATCSTLGLVLFARVRAAST